MKKTSMKKPDVEKKQIVVPQGLRLPDLATKELLVWQRDQAIYATWDYLYDVKRIRGDDILLELQGLFFLSERTVVEILRKRPDKAPEVAPVQGGLFD